VERTKITTNHSEHGWDSTTFHSDFSIKSDQVYLSEQDDVNRCLNYHECDRDADSNKAVISAPLFSSFPLTIDGSVASFSAGSHRNIACGRRTGHRFRRITHPAGRMRCRRDLVSFRRDPSRWWLGDAYVVMPPLSTLARATSICTIVPHQVVSHTESCPLYLPTPCISVWGTVYMPMYTNFYSTKRSGGESEGWFLSFRTPTISSIEKTQPGFQTILMGDRSTPERSV
jgi:hypothetical protein